MLELSHEQRHVSRVGLVNVLPEGDDLASCLPGEGNRVVDLCDLLLLGVSRWYLRVIDEIGVDGVDKMKQELAVAQTLVLEALYPMLLSHSFVGPGQQLLIVYDANTLHPVQLADLPHQTKHKGGLSINDVDTADSH